MAEACDLVDVQEVDDVEIKQEEAIASAHNDENDIELSEVQIQVTNKGESVMAKTATREQEFATSAEKSGKEGNEIDDKIFELTAKLRQLKSNEAFIKCSTCQLRRELDKNRKKKVAWFKRGAKSKKIQLAAANHSSEIGSIDELLRVDEKTSVIDFAQRFFILTRIQSAEIQKEIHVRAAVEIDRIVRASERQRQTIGTPPNANHSEIETANLGEDARQSSIDDGLIEEENEESTDFRTSIHARGRRYLAILRIQYEEFEQALDEVMTEVCKLARKSERRQIISTLDEKLNAFMPASGELTLIHSMSDDSAVSGLTSLDNEMYVKFMNRPDIAVYDTLLFSLLRYLPVPGLGAVSDMASCIEYKCIYVADWTSNMIRRVEKVSNIQTQWSVGDDRPDGLSVNSKSDHNVIVTFNEVSKVKVFTTYGELVKDISLQSDIVHPWHKIQLSADIHIISHGKGGDPLHRICTVDDKGCIQQSFGGTPGSTGDQINLPLRIAVVRNDCIVVADVNNKRLLVLNSMLRCVQMLSGLSGYPSRVWFDKGIPHKLYVAVNQWDSSSDKHTSGRIEVYTVGY